MSSKTAKIEKCKFLRLWNNPNGKDLYYHELKMSNGDIGNVGTVDKYPEKINEGQTITYTIEGNKMKLEQVQVANQSQGTSTANTNPGKKSSSAKPSYTGKPKTQADYLGFSYSYAKDLIIAGKTKPKDIQELKKIAEEIYLHVGKLLMGKSLEEMVHENPLGPYPDEQK